MQPSSEWGSRTAAQLEPDAYSSTLDELKAEAHSVRLRTQRTADIELLQLWWRIGNTILRRLAQQGWEPKSLPGLRLTSAPRFLR